MTIKSLTKNFKSSILKFQKIYHNYYSPVFCALFKSSFRFNYNFSKLFLCSLFIFSVSCHSFSKVGSLFDADLPENQTTDKERITVYSVDAEGNPVIQSSRSNQKNASPSQSRSRVYKNLFPTNDLDLTKNSDNDKEHITTSSVQTEGNPVIQPSRSRRRNISAIQNRSNAYKNELPANNSVSTEITDHNVPEIFNQLNTRFINEENKSSNIESNLDSLKNGQNFDRVLMENYRIPDLANTNPNNTRKAKIFDQEGPTIEETDFTKVAKQIMNRLSIDTNGNPIIKSKFKIRNSIVPNIVESSFIKTTKQIKNINLMGTKKFPNTPIKYSKDFNHLITVKTNGSPLNIRDLPFKNATVIGKISNGSITRILDRSDNWLRINHSIKFPGWINKLYTKEYKFPSNKSNNEHIIVSRKIKSFDHLVKVITKGAYLNIRDLPFKRGKIVGKISNGKIVRVIDESNNWLKIIYSKNFPGWINRLYTKHKFPFSHKLKGEESIFCPEGAIV